MTMEYMSRTWLCSIETSRKLSSWTTSKTTSNGKKKTVLRYSHGWVILKTESFSNLESFYRIWLVRVLRMWERAFENIPIRDGLVKHHQRDRWEHLNRWRKGITSWVQLSISRRIIDIQELHKGQIGLHLARSKS